MYTNCLALEDAVNALDESADSKRRLTIAEIFWFPPWKRSERPPTSWSHYRGNLLALPFLQQAAVQRHVTSLSPFFPIYSIPTRKKPSSSTGKWRPLSIVRKLRRLTASGKYATCDRYELNIFFGMRRMTVIIVLIPKTEINCRFRIWLYAFYPQRALDRSGKGPNAKWPGPLNSESIILTRLTFIGQRGLPWQILIQGNRSVFSSPPAASVLAEERLANGNLFFRGLIRFRRIRSITT